MVDLTERLSEDERTSFVEAGQCRRLAQALVRSPFNGDAGERAADRLISIVKGYSQCPTLLDAALPELLPTLLARFAELLAVERSFLRRERKNKPQAEAIARCVYTICITRKPLAAISFFPTDVHFVTSVIEDLKSQLLDGGSTADENQASRSTAPYDWTVTYVLLSWLALLILTPFPLATFSQGARDAPPDEAEARMPQLVLDVIAIIKKALCHLETFQSVAAIVAARLLARPDCKDLARAALDQLVTNLIEETRAEGAAATLRSPECAARSFFALLKALLKHVPVAHLQATDMVQSVIEPLLLDAELTGVPAEVVRESSRLPLEGLARWLQTLGVRKLYVTTLGYLGVCVLPQPPVKWKYTKYSARRLESSTGAGTLEAAGHASAVTATWPFPGKVVDALLQLLFRFVRAEEASIRWAAAKGIARICERLPCNSCAYLLDTTMVLVAEFEDSDRLDDGGVVGGLLTLALLIIKGCVLAEHLTRLPMTSICKAVCYEPRSPAYGLGGRRIVGTLDASVRDAACFVLYALARTYDPDRLKPYTDPMVEALTLTSLFDTDINCRRAAAAALQEALGRHEDVPDGVHLASIVNYYDLSTLSNSYLSTAVAVARLPNRATPLVQFLLDTRLFGEERALRELAASTLKRIFRELPDFGIAIELLDSILLRLKGPTKPPAEVLHGSLLGVNAILLASLEGIEAPVRHPPLQKDTPKALIDVLGHEWFTSHKNITARNDFIKEAHLRLIGTVICLSDPTLSQHSTTQATSGAVMSGLVWTGSQGVQLSAVETLYLCSLHRAPLFSDIKEQVERAILSSSVSSQPEIIRGLLLAKGLCAYASSSESEVADSIRLLCGEVLRPWRLVNKGSSGAPLSCPDGRQAAVIALAFAVSKWLALVCEKRHDEENLPLTREAGLLRLVVQTLDEASLDYQFDRRGDVGSWVREAAIEVAALVLQNVPMWLAEGVDALSIDLSEVFKPYHRWQDKLLSSILRQVADKYDRTRGRAAFLVSHLGRHARAFKLSSTDPGRVGSKSTASPLGLHPTLFYQRAYYLHSYEIDELRAPDAELAYLNMDDPRRHPVICSVSCICEIQDLIAKIPAALDAKERQTVAGRHGEMTDKGAQSAIHEEAVNEFSLAALRLPEVMAQDPRADIDRRVLAASGAAQARAEVTAGAPPLQAQDTGFSLTRPRLTSAMRAAGLYDYTRQNFLKHAVSIKLPEFLDNTLPFRFALSVLTLRIPIYTRAILEGFSNAIGGTVGHVQTQAVEALTEYLEGVENGKDVGEMAEITDSALAILARGLQARLTSTKGTADLGFQHVPTSAVLATAAVWISRADHFSLTAAGPFLEGASTVLAQSRVIASLRNACTLCCALCVARRVSSSSSGDQSKGIQPVGDECTVRRRALALLLHRGVRHRFPTVRNFAAESLYATLVGMSDEQVCDYFRLKPKPSSAEGVSSQILPLLLAIAGGLDGPESSSQDDPVIDPVSESVSQLDTLFELSPP